MKTSIMAKCKERNDTWGNQVNSRLAMVHDLHAADAIYHKQCSSNFRTQKQIPKSYETIEQASKKIKTGRPVIDDVQKAYDEVVQYLIDNDDEQITVQDLVDHMDKTLRIPCFCLLKKMDEAKIKIYIWGRNCLYRHLQKI